MGDPAEWSEEQRSQVAELRHAIHAYLASKPGADRVGKRYAMEMAQEACALVGIDPSRVTPDGYDQEPADE